MVSGMGLYAGGDAGRSSPQATRALVSGDNSWQPSRDSAPCRIMRSLLRVANKSSQADDRRNTELRLCVEASRSGGCCSGDNTRPTGTDVDTRNGFTVGNRGVGV